MSDGPADAIAKLFASLTGDKDHSDNEGDGNGEFLNGKGKEPADQEICAVLKAACQRIQTKNPFVVGQFVTPRANFNVKGAGKPSIVCDVFSNPKLMENTNDEDGNMRRVPDMTVLTCVKDSRGNPQYVRFSAESYAYEPYVGKATN